MTRTRIMRQIVFLALSIPLIGASGRPLQDQTFFEREHAALKAKIVKEEPEPRGKALFDAYLVWMERKAADRDKAQDLAARAANAGSPYWEERFLDLVEDAQHSANFTVNLAIGYYVTVGWQWKEAVEHSLEYGGPLYQKARALSLDSARVREGVRCNVRYAIGDVESNSQSVYCLYGDRVVSHGTEKDAEGNWRQPRMEFDIYCLPRSAFHLEAEGEVMIPADIGLGWVEEIRNVCRLFDLSVELGEATDLMNQFLKDALCLTRRKDLGWYLNLAEKYRLDPAKEWIEGFYGAVTGTVYLMEGETRRKASGAKVTIYDADREISGTADTEGRYSLSKAPLCGKRCTPIRIGAVHQGRSTDDQYFGELEEPNPNASQEKDLTIIGGNWRWSGTVGLEILDQNHCVLDESDQKQTRSRQEVEDTIQIATLRLSWQKDDIYHAQADALSGSLSTHISELRRVFSSSPVVQIQGSLYGGGHLLERSTFEADGLQPLNPENTKVMISRDFESMQSEIERLGRKAGSGDLNALDRMNALLSGEPANGEQIVIQVMIFPDQEMKTEATEFRESKEGRNPKKIERNERTSSMIPIPPLAIDFRARFLRDPKGNHRIEGYSSVPEESPSSAGPKCPHRIITRIGNIRLDRRAIP